MIFAETGIGQYEPVVEKHEYLPHQSIGDGIGTISPTTRSSMLPERLPERLPVQLAPVIYDPRERTTISPAPPTSPTPSSLIQTGSVIPTRTSVSPTRLGPAVVPGQPVAPSIPIPAPSEPPRLAPTTQVPPAPPAPVPVPPVPGIIPSPGIPRPAPRTPDPTLVTAALLPTLPDASNVKWAIIGGVAVLGLLGALVILR